jgi:hypothetical protein
MGFEEALVNPPHGHHITHLVVAYLLGEHRPTMRIP